jgi:hypothetical protein
VKNPAKKIAAMTKKIDTTPATMRAQTGNRWTAFGRCCRGELAELAFVTKAVGWSWVAGLVML